MRHPASPRVDGALVGLAVVAFAAIFYLGFLAFGDRAITAAAERPDPVSGWSNERLMGELGDYDQKLDCALVGLDGLSGYVWVSVDVLTGQPTRFLFICKP